MIEVLPTIPRTFSLWTSFRASEATWPGSVCSVSIEYWIGRPLMPPLSLTQSKYAFAVFGMSVKSVPGCLVAIPPSLIGVPVAFLPLPRPHFDAVAAGSAAALLELEDELAPELELDDELLLLLPPQAATTRATAITATANAQRIPRDPRSMRIAPPPSYGFTVASPPARRARAAGRPRRAGRASPAPPRRRRRGPAGRRPRAAD